MPYFYTSFYSVCAIKTRIPFHHLKIQVALSCEIATSTLFICEIIIYKYLKLSIDFRQGSSWDHSKQPQKSDV